MRKDDLIVIFKITFNVSTYNSVIKQLTIIVFKGTILVIPDVPPLLSKIYWSV